MSRKNKPTKDIYCHNCRLPLTGNENFCPNCGQKNDIRPLSIKLFFNNLLGNFFNFDNRIWHTIIQLVKSPGKVPNDFIAGKRVRYSNPFKFLLQVSILYFLLAGLFEIIGQTSTNKFIIAESDKTFTKNDYVKFFDSINQKNHFVQKIKNPKISKKEKDSLLQENLLFTNLYFGFHSGNIQLKNKRGYEDLNNFLKQKGITYTFYPRIPKSANYDKQGFFDKIFTVYKAIANRIYRDMRDDEIIQRLDIAPNLTNKLAVKIAKRLYSINIDANSRAGFKKEIISKISMGLFLILPILALFYQLFYWRKRSFTETLIYLFYVQSVYFIILIFTLFSDAILPEAIAYFISILINLWFIYYLYKSSRVYFKTKKIGNWLKTLLLVIPIYSLLSVIGILLITLLSLVL